MPTYIVTVAATYLAGDKKARLATAITGIHSDVTGADGFLARVAFHPIAATDCFLGGAPLGDPHCYIDARIRAGRTAAARRELMRRIVEAAAAILDMPAAAVWVYLTEFAPEAMIEYGHVLPEPGREAEWLADLPEADRAFVRRVTQDKS